MKNINSYRIPCQATMWIDEYAAQADKDEARAEAITADWQRLEEMAIRYVEALHPDMEFETEEEWQQWVADHADLIIEWSN